MTGSGTQWTDSALWRQLLGQQEEAAKQVRLTLDQHLPRVQQLLQTAGTAPTAFTLHDAGHAFRVAQRMMNVMPEETASTLSCYELALLLLSAYLHDIGMHPDEKYVNGVHQYLLTGSAEVMDATRRQTFDLPPAEKDALLAWLDNEQTSLTPPLAVPTVSPGSLALARELTALYCRDRHNVWSAQWMARELGDATLGSYAHWLDDLILLCTSHHFGFSQLRDGAFNPRPVGQPARVVHLRYLACVLRVADILEFDPERTPEVVFRHRAIPDQSLIFWYKDHDASLTLENGRVLLFARPKTAIVHKALLTMQESISQELRLCRKLDDDTSFAYVPGLAKTLPYRWVLLPDCGATIQPQPGSYEYIEGTFRPNTPKLLDLLSGQALYSEPLAAVRELLQNAFDAVREQIAYERLEQPDSAAQEVASAFASVHRVELRLDATDGITTLCCSDDGVGMSKAIICNHLLVSGTRQRHDVRALERRCEKAGFRLGRTGQFGIGVLSYFMLANHLTVLTRRSTQPGDDDGSGWRFETGGVGEFGELRRIARAKCGTEVTLRLKDAERVARGDFASALLAYLRDTVRRVPCRFIVRIGSEVALESQPGWLQSPSELLQRAAEAISKRDTSDREDTGVPVPARKRKRQLEEHDSVSRAIALALSSVRWDTREGPLRGDLGTFRVSAASFALGGGVSLVVLQERGTEHGVALEPVGSGQAMMPSGGLRLSWKGMRTDLHQGMTLHAKPEVLNLWREVGDLGSAFVEVDFDNPSAGEIEVARGGFELADDGRLALVSASEECKGLNRAIALSNADSRYATLNAMRAAVCMRIDDPHWIRRLPGRQGEVSWSTICFPAVSREYFSSTDDPPDDLEFQGVKLTVLPSIEVVGPRLYENRTMIDPQVAPVDAVAPYGSAWSFRPLPVWVHSPFSSGNTMRQGRIEAEFPPGWQRVIGAKFERTGDDVLVWNRAAKVVQASDDQAWRWAMKMPLAEFFGVAAEPRLLLADPSRAAAWFLGSFVRLNRSRWDGLMEQYPTFWDELMRFLMGEVLQELPVVFFAGAWDIIVADGKLWRMVRSYNADIATLLPKVPPSWLVVPSRSRPGAAGKNPPSNGDKRGNREG
jgi:Histidine kinase-, DNA gyrase B-, and HSP90-like ATPase